MFRGRVRPIVLAFLLVFTGFTFSSSDSHLEQTDSAVAEAGPDQIVSEGELAHFNGSSSIGSTGATIFGKNVKVNDDHPVPYNGRKRTSVVVDSDGVVHVIWEELTGVPNMRHVHYAKSTDGGTTFQPSVSASNYSNKGNYGHLLSRLAVGLDGTVHVVWTNFEAYLNPMVYYARSIDNGSSFESPKLTAQRNMSTAMQVDSKGVLHIMMTESLSGSGFNAYHLVSEDNGESFGEAHRLNDVEGTAGGGDMVIDEAGNIHVVWADRRDWEVYRNDLYYAKSTDNGETFSKGVRVDDWIEDLYLGPIAGLVVDSNHNPIVFWLDYRFLPDSAIMYSISYDGGASFSKDNLFLKEDRNGSVELAGFDVGIGSDDLVRVMWGESFQTWRDRNIWYSELDVVKGVVSNRVLVTDDFKNYTDQGVWSIDVDSEDGTHAVWLDNRNTKDNGYEIFYAKSKKGRAEIVTYEWDMNNLLDSNADGNFTNDVEETGPTPTHVYGDDGMYTVTLSVTDAAGATAYDTATVTVFNVDPTIQDVSYEMGNVDVSILFRIAGEKWHDVELYLYEDSAEVGYATIARYPGSPNDHIVSLGDFSVDLSKSYSAIAYYTPEDDPINGQVWGATPAWFILTFENEEKRIHHTFNVRHEDTWVWNMKNVNQHFPIVVTFEATAYDPGSDDLRFTWDFGDAASVSKIYYNNGLGPDPYPSPDVNPITVTDSKRHTFTVRGTYTIMITVEDDDGGIVQHSFELKL